MVKSLCIYENSNLKFTTNKVDELIANAVIGFRNIATQTYNDTLQSIKIGNDEIKVFSPCSSVVVFSLNDANKDLVKAYNLYCEAKRENNMALMESLY